MSPQTQPLPPRKIKLPWLLLGLLGVATVSAGAGALLAMTLASTPLLQSRLSPEESKVFGQGEIATGLNFRLPRLTRPVNIMVLGIKVLSSDVDNPPPEVRDLGYHALVNSFDGLSDTMLMLRFNPETGKLVVLSVPRDTRTRVAGLGVTKLNEANAYGGPALTAQSISNLLGGVPVDRYVRINVQGVEKLIDALGGVTVYVPKDMKYTDHSQHLYIDLKQGEQHLNGEQALQFLRFRYDAYGDIGRVQRQQTLMRALVEQTLSPATLTRIPQILSVIQENVDTNLTVEELVALVGFAAQLKRADLQMLMLPGEFSGAGDYEASYWLPSYSRIQEMSSQYFGLNPASSETVADPYAEPGVDSVPAETDYGIEIAIQDSTGNLAAAEQLMFALREAGFYNVYIDENWSEPLRETRIIAQGGDLAKAEAVRRSLGLGEVRVEGTGNLQSDVTVQVGTDWRVE
ncbi:LCP family protein [Thermoleptolyngbya sp. M55_K2018_002]|uniref:LCP family protein n=1 Tax=Thermoleptolyngbya sp. M55_K2018_002 TaxID=2747808 RepID=UPI0025EF355F|nr:LCP family protein [Thermoleptolyngbya sp. M55_K2018_002]